MLAVLIILPLFTALAQSDDDERNTDVNDYEARKAEGYKLKTILFDLGYWHESMSMGFGFRYSNFGAMMGLANFTNKLPGYDNTILPESSVGYTEKHRSLTISFDAYYFHNIYDNLDAYANIGFASGADSILARSNSPQADDELHRYKSENFTHITCGFGVDYYLAKWLSLGLGFHTERGVFFRLGYFWY